MEDPYVYKGTDILINKFNIRNKELLDMAEDKFVTKKLLRIDELLIDVKVIDYDYLLRIHNYLFEDIYPFAGKERNIPIVKAEGVLGGDTVRYMYPNGIKRTAEEIIMKISETDWGRLDIDERTEKYSRLIALLWQVHPFREGNTRTVMTFASHFAEKNGFAFDKSIIAENSVYVRKSLVLASDGMYADYKYLNKIFKGAMESGENKWIENDLRKSGFSVTDFHKSNIKELSRCFGRIVSVKEIKEMYMLKDSINLSLEQKSLLSKCTDDFIKEEKAKKKVLEHEITPEP